MVLNLSADQLLVKIIPNCPLFVSGPLIGTLNMIHISTFLDILVLPFVAHLMV